MPWQRLQTFNISGEIDDIDPAVVSVENGGSSRGLGDSGRFLAESILQEYCMEIPPPPQPREEVCPLDQPNQGPYLEEDEICDGIQPNMGPIFEIVEAC